MGLFSSDPASHFPVVKGRRLSGDDVSIPHDLPADATLLVVAFQDALDPLSDQWARLGDRLVAAHGARFAVWEVPVLTSALRHLGGLGTMGVRHQVESDLERDRTVPLFVDVKAFRKELKLKSNDVYALLVARDGRIAWRGEGDIDLDEVSALEAAVAELLEAPVPLPTDHPDLEAESAEAAEDERAPENEGDAHGAGGPAADLEDETTADAGLEADGAAGPALEDEAAPDEGTPPGGAPGRTPGPPALEAEPRRVSPETRPGD